MPKAPPSARLRGEIAAFLQDAGAAELGAGLLSRLVQLGPGRLVQEALEQEQTDFVGRERYAHTPSRGSRNGYVPGDLETAEGRVAVAVPQVRAAGQPYRSALYDFLRGHSDVVQTLVTEMYASGLSTRDIEAAFTDATGHCLVSKSGVSELTEALWDEYQAFSQQELCTLDVLYLFLDGL